MSIYVQISPTKMVAVGSAAHKAWIEENKPKAKPRAKRTVKTDKSQTEE